MSGATRRLYFEDPFLAHFVARVTAHGTWQQAGTVILDQTAFYPESGGQLADAGTLSGVPVIDVQVDDDGRIHHVLGGNAPRIGDEVHGQIDWSRRRLHMAMHSGQHMLSRALLDVAKAETVSSRLGERVCTIDVSRPEIPERYLADAEALVNAVIEDDLPVTAYFPTPDELARLPLRRDPKVDREVRVIKFADYDVSPCGGTHVTRTGQVGMVRITGVERYKGMTRVSFQAGRRAREGLFAESDALRDLARSFTCGPLQVTDAVGKLRRELAETREALGQARTRLADDTAEELASAARGAGRTWVAHVFDGYGQDFLAHVGKRITAEPGMVALLADRTADGLAVLVARGEGSAVHCGELLGQLAKAAGGRGGGRDAHAQGKLPAGVDWVALATGAMGADAP